MSEYSESLRNKNIIVTGANTGIGYVAALDFAKRGANVILACRNEKLGNEAVEKIKAESKSESVQLEQLDLGSLANTRSFAERILAKWDRLDILVNNAGLAGIDFKLTADGFETHFQVNYLGHYLLTRLLLDLLKKSQPSRIINVSSIAHTMTDMKWDDLQYEKDYVARYAYGQSKLAQILNAFELSKRLEGTGVTAVSLHPGVVKTDIWRNRGQDSSAFIKFLMAFIRPMVGIFGISSDDGAKTTIHCATSDEIPSQNGKYFAESKVETDPKKVKDYAFNPESASKLWDISAKLVGLEP